MTTRPLRFESAAPVIMVSCGVIGIVSLFTHQNAITIICVALGMTTAFGQPALENAGDDPVLRAVVLKRLGIGAIALAVLLAASAILSSRMDHTMNEIAVSERVEADARLLYRADFLAHSSDVAFVPWADLPETQRTVWRDRAMAAR